MNLFKSKERIAIDKRSKEIEADLDKKERDLENRIRIEHLMAEHKLAQAEKKLVKEAKEAEYVEVRKQLYTMPHHHRLRTREDTWVERVPGGWIYTYETKDKVKADATTFVPYENGADETYNKLKQTDD